MNKRRCVAGCADGDNCGLSQSFRLFCPTPPFKLNSPNPCPSRRAATKSWPPCRHQVIIVCGETGSGKTTQLPKMALALGRGRLNWGQARQAGPPNHGHTQPRRIAASSVAKRIAEELKTPLGEVVGFKVRFQDRLSKNASVKLMTDGILLAETQNDPLLQSLRHPHHRRGPRAQPEHRLFAGLLARNLAAQPGFENHRHLGHD